MIAAVMVLIAVALYYVTEYEPIRAGEHSEILEYCKEPREMNEVVSHFKYRWDWRSVSDTIELRVMVDQLENLGFLKIENVYEFRMCNTTQEGLQHLEEL